MGVTNTSTGTCGSHLSQMGWTTLMKKIPAGTICGGPAGPLCYALPCIKVVLSSILLFLPSLPSILEFPGGKVCLSSMGSFCGIKDTSKQTSVGKVKGKIWQSIGTSLPWNGPTSMTWSMFSKSKKELFLLADFSIDDH